MEKETKNIYQSITAIMKDMPAIGKNKKNAQQGFMFRGIDDVMNTLQPLLSKYKVFIVPEILEQTREERATQKGSTLIYSICKIKYRFYAEDGSYIEAITIGEGMDSGDKATNKAMAIAMKYALFQVFCIPTEEMKDPDSETPEPTTSPVIDKNKAIALNKSIENNKISDEIVELILSQYGYSSTSEIRMKDYTNIVNDLISRKWLNDRNSRNTCQVVI